MISPKPKTVLELYEGHPERWCQAANARNAQGESVEANDPDAVQWCLQGASRFVAENSLTSLELCNKLRDEIGGSIAFFNDYSHNTFSNVLDVVRRVGI